MRKKQKNIYWVMLLVLFALGSYIQTSAQTKHRSVKPKQQAATVVINEQGFSRTSISLRRGVLTHITFLRQTEATCATSIRISDYGIDRELPLNTPVVVTFTPVSSGEVGFSCGMNMLHGKLIVR